MAPDSPPQIPPALLRLLADLEAKPPSIQELVVDLGGDELEDYFTSVQGYQGGGSAGGNAYSVGGIFSYHRRQVRLRVFTAIGNCRSLQKIHLNPHLKFDVYSVSEAEATALFQGLQSNPVLYWLDVSGWRGFGTAAACEALAGLVRSSCTLRLLNLTSTGLTGGGLGHIAAALQANTRSIIASLNVVGNRIGDAAGALHLADILASTPTLRRLRMFDISMDEAGGGVIANALAHNTTLEDLGIGWWQGLATNSSTNQSAALALTRILAALSAPMDAGAPGASAFNTHIKQLYLLVHEDGLEPIEAGVGEAVAHMLRSNATLEQLQITTSFVGHGLEALRHNTSITELRVVHETSTKVDLHKLIPIVRSCQTLQRLQYNNDNLPPGFKRQVFRSLKDNPSIKTLVIDGWEDLDDGMFKDLMESLQVNTNLEAISLERTSWKLDGKEAIIEQALKYNKRQVAYLDDLYQHGDMEFTSPKAGRLFLCGFGFAGKTTLRKSMIRSWSKSIKQPSSSFVSGSLPWAKSRRTQGIEIQMLRDDDTMQVSIWDLAGQDKFRALQSVLFPSISQACVFLFVFSWYDRETHQLKPEKSLDEELRHWMRFIASNSSNQGHVLPQVFVILSHLAARHK